MRSSKSCTRQENLLGMAHAQSKYQWRKCATCFPTRAPHKSLTCLGIAFPMTVLLCFTFWENPILPRNSAFVFLQNLPRVRGTDTLIGAKHLWKNVRLFLPPKKERFPISFKANCLFVFSLVPGIKKQVNVFNQFFNTLTGDLHANLWVQGATGPDHSASNRNQLQKHGCFKRFDVFTVEGLLDSGFGHPVHLNPGSG